MTCMKFYIVLLLQLMVWSGYTFIEWLSRHDQLVHKVIMFFIFFYLAFMIGRAITKSDQKSIFITTFSLLFYSSIHYTVLHLLH